MSDWVGVAGRRVVITGATGGIGLAAAEALYRLGALLSIVARSEERAAEAVGRIQAAATSGDTDAVPYDAEGVPDAAVGAPHDAGGPEPAPVDVFLADLSSQAEVTRLAAELLARYPRIDVLINNAGAMFTRRRLTADGIEATWALNHLAPFLLTELLVDHLKQHPPARIITTSSDAHRREHIPFDDLSAQRSYRGFRRYGQTKLANIAFTAELARRLEGSGVTANCYHPGLVATGWNRNNGRMADLGMKLIRPFSRTPEKGAETLVWLADSPEAAGYNGAYFFDQAPVAPSREAQNVEVARRLWSISRDQTGLMPGL